MSCVSLCRATLNEPQTLRVLSYSYMYTLWHTWGIRPVVSSLMGVHVLIGAWIVLNLTLAVVRPDLTCIDADRTAEPCVCVCFTQVSEQYNKAVVSEEVNQLMLDEAIRTLNDDSVDTPLATAPPASCCKRGCRRATACDWSFAPLWRWVRESSSRAPGLPGPVKRIAKAIVANPLFDVLSMSVIIANVVRGPPVTS